jgi:hypothetical protein
LKKKILKIGKILTPYQTLSLPKLLHEMDAHIFSLRSRRQNKALSLPTFPREMNVHILSLRSRRQSKA